jgi:hypothetical protein
MKIDLFMLESLCFGLSVGAFVLAIDMLIIAACH